MAGKSRQGLPVRAIHNTASTNRRLSAPLRPGSDFFPRQCGSIFAHWASVSKPRSIASLKHDILIEKKLNLNRPSSFWESGLRGIMIDARIAGLRNEGIWRPSEADRRAGM